MGFLKFKAYYTYFGRNRMAEGIMSGYVTFAMVNNATLLLALSIVYEISYIFRFRLKKCVSIFNGIVIGLIGIAIMSYPFTLFPGLFFDTRSILICVTALIFGFAPASIAAVMTIIYRITIGGIGVLPGVMVIIVSLALGLLFKRFTPLSRTRFRWLKIYAFGITVHIGMLACMLLLSWEMAIQTLIQIGFSVLLVYPVGVVLLALLLLRQSEYKEAMAVISEADSRYKSLFSDNHSVMLLLDPSSGQIVDANPAAIAFYGWPESEIKKMHISQINTLSQDQIKVEMKASSEKRRNYFLFTHNRADGNPIDVEVYSGPIEFSGRKLLYSIVHDISARTAALHALQESEERFRTLVDNAPDTIFVITDGEFVFVNKAGLKLLGASKADELLGKSGLSIIHPDYHDDVAQYMSDLRAGKASPTPEERAYIRLDNTTVYVDVIVVPIRYNNKDGDLVYARDITERKHHEEKEQDMEAQLRQQQKLEAIGTLAGGVAHEINNPLNGIMNYAQLILDASDKETNTATYSSEIIHETERISVIVKNLLQFSRHEKRSHSYASIYDIIDQTISLVNTIINKDQIKLEIRLDDNLPDIKCRSQQIQQVIMNLITNAKDALNERYPDYDENKVIELYCSEYQNEGRRWLHLIVKDYGIGIPLERGERIFEPFYSTKPKEMGTGLGLSISYGIVSEHHGKMTFESVVGEYTVFMVDLPVDNGWSL